MSLATTVAHAESASSPDVAAIKTVVEAVAVLADSRNFEALEKLYAEEVDLDYSSLSGAGPDLVSPQALMTQWASMLPGFDRTRHAISDVRVDLKGATAIASAEVVADHYVDDMHWRVSGDYRYELASVDDQWRITAATFNLRDEVGTRDALAVASENAAANPPSYLARKATIELVRTMLTALEQKDMETFASLWAEDAVQDMPYSPEGHPKRVVGREKLLQLWAGWPQNSGKADFTSELVIYPMQDPEMVFVEFKGDVEVIPTGRRYLQTYGGLFHVAGGKIALYREYYDPAPFAWAFGLE